MGTLIPQQQRRNRRRNTTGSVYGLPCIVEDRNPLEVGHGNSGAAGTALEEHSALIIL
jgi:hypothetical protein